MDTHKGQTKYCITMNDENSDIVKITRAKPGTIPGRWHSEEEVKLDSVSQDVYGTSKQTVEKMFQEIADSKEDESTDADSKEDESTDADSKEDESKEDVADNNADLSLNAKLSVADVADEKVDSKDAAGAGNEDDEKDKMMKERAAHRKELTDAIAARSQQIRQQQIGQQQMGEGRKTRKHNKRTTRKKNRKGPHSKSNKNKRKHTRGKK